MGNIADNIEMVRERIASAAGRAGRDPSSITLVAVTKTVDVGRMLEALDAGLADFGESYYQEAREKLDQFPDDVRWHFIGHLQSNKARYIVGRFALIHSVDSLALARELGHRAELAGIVQPILLEVKLDPAETKFGIPLESCVEVAGEAARIRGVALQGFMGMAPYGSDAEVARPGFRRLQEQFARLPESSRSVLSMGMTNDFEVAIEEGATHVRIGTALFGERIRAA